MRKGRKWRLALAGAVLLVGGISLAAEDPVAREKIAIDGLQSANALSVRDGVYVQTRDALLTGGGSLKAKLDAWETEAQHWMAGWMGILGLMDLNDNIPYSAFEAALTTQLNSQATQLIALTRQAAEIKTQGGEVQGLFGNVPGPGADSYPGTDTYRTVIDGLVGREGDLKAALSTMSTLADSKIAIMRDLDTRSRVAIMSRLRSALLAKGRYPLEQTLTAVQQLLDAEKVVDPLLAQATKIENDLDRQSLKFQIFHLRDAITVGNQYCADGRAALNGITGAAGYVAAGRARLNQLCAAMEDHHQSLVGLGVSDTDLVAAYIENERVVLQTVCVTNVKPAVNCEKLATLAALDAADYQSMDEAQLRFVEYGWADNLDAARRKGAGQ